MTGRAKGHQARIILTAHQTEMMARQKALGPVRKYMPKEQAPKQDNASGVLAMLRRFKAKQDGRVA